MTTASVRRLEEFAKARLGQTLAGRFQLERLLAIGGMAAVYEAIQKPLNRRVAVKILHPTEIEAGRRDYFLREANAVAALRHPNIISIVDFGQDDKTLFLAMEHVPGKTFSQLLSESYPLDFSRLIHIVEQVCLALEVAHHANVIHCDMKPSNIMIESMPGNPDHVKVLDFGIAKTLQKEIDPNEKAQDEEIIGSYYYMAPEQIMGRPVSPQTDIYGLGIVMYTSITAAFPFDEPDDASLMQAILQKTPTRPGLIRPELMIPPELEAIVLKAVAKDPRDRFSSCAEMRRALLKVKTQGNSLEAGVLESLDAPHSLEMLLPEDELFEVDIDLDLDLSEDDDFYSEDPISELLPSLELPQSGGQTGAIPLDMVSSFGEALPKPLVELDSAVLGRAPIIGREQQLNELEQAAILTRRGCVAVRVSGPRGCGRSFFLNRGMEMLNRQMGAMILLCTLSPGDQEYPLRALSRLVNAALDEYQGMLGGETRPEAGPATSYQLSILQRLRLGRLETSTLHSLLQHWGPDRASYEQTPLRFAETRHQLLVHAFAELLRALIVTNREKSHTERSQRAPLVLVLEGWEYCDEPTQELLRQIITERRNMPLLFAASFEDIPPMEQEVLPEDFSFLQSPPFLDGRDWDVSIQLTSFTPEEVRTYIRYRLNTDPGDAFIQKMHAASGGNALLIKDLLHMLSGQTPAPGEALSWGTDQLPESPARAFGLQIDRLSRDGKMLLAVCTLLGSNFPEETVHGVMPDGFDVDGTFTELFSARILEPTEDKARLCFRYPAMRTVSMRRLHPKLSQGLHARIAGLLGDRPVGLAPEEAEPWKAIHTIQSGAPLAAMHIMLDSAQSALSAWEPLLALRRCRQVQSWLSACLELQRSMQGQHDSVQLENPSLHEIEVGPILSPEVALEVSPEMLEVLSLRATLYTIEAARKLGEAPDNDPNALIPTHFPQNLLQKLEKREHLSLRLRGELSLEIGRYLARVELPQSARRAFQVAAAFARRLQDDVMLTSVELEMVRNLHRLGRLSQAVELANHTIRSIRSLVGRPGYEDLSMARPLDRLAKIYIERRLYPRAEHFLDQARALAEANHDRDRLGKIYLHYAALYRAQNNHTRTLQALQRALECAHYTHDLRAMARVLYNQGVSAAHLGRRSDARLYLSEAVEVAINLGWTDFITLVNQQIKRL